MAAVLATAASPSPLASDERADERFDWRETRSSSSFIESYLEAAATAIRAVNFIAERCSLLSHTSDINDLLEGLDGVLEDWLNRLHDSESSFHIVDLWLHSFDGFHLSGNFNEWLSIIKSLEDSGSKSFLDVLDGSGLGNGGITISSGLG
jgi:hypothetical protein